MQKRPLPESPEAAASPHVMAQALATLTPEEFQRRCEGYDERQLRAVIGIIEQIFTIQASIFKFFRSDRHSDEDALRGINSYASGKMRALNKSISDGFSEFMLASAQIEEFRTGVPAAKSEPAESPEQKQKKLEDEKELALSEEYARQYLALSRVRPTLEAHLARFREVFGRLAAVETKQVSSAKKM